MEETRMLTRQTICTVDNQKCLKVPFHKGLGDDIATRKKSLSYTFFILSFNDVMT